MIPDSHTKVVFKKKKKLTEVLSGSGTRRHPQGPACTHTCCHLRTPRVSGRHASNCLTCKGSRPEIKQLANIAKEGFRSITREATVRSSKGYCYNFRESIDAFRFSRLSSQYRPLEETSMKSDAKVKIMREKCHLFLCFTSATIFFHLSVSRIDTQLCS